MRGNGGPIKYPVENTGRQGEGGAARARRPFTDDAEAVPCPSGRPLRRRSRRVGRAAPGQATLPKLLSIAFAGATRPPRRLSWAIGPPGNSV